MLLWKEGTQLPVGLLMSSAAIVVSGSPPSVAQIVSGVSAISSSLCRIISRSTVYLGTETAAVESRKQHTPPLHPASQPRSRCGRLSCAFASVSGPLFSHLAACVHFHNRVRGTEEANSDLDCFPVVGKSGKEG